MNTLRTSEDIQLREAQPRAPLPGDLFRRLSERGVGEFGQRLLDLTEPSVITAESFRSFGTRVTVGELGEERRGEVLIHPSSAAENGDGPKPASELDPESFQAVADLRCTDLIQSRAALEAVSRLLEDGGQLALATTGWMARPRSPADRTEELLSKHFPDWQRSDRVGVYPEWMCALENSGFERCEMFSFDYFERYRPEEWEEHTKQLAAELGEADGVSQMMFENELQTLVRDELGGDTIQIQCRAFAIVARWAE